MKKSIITILFIICFFAASPLFADTSSVTKRLSGDDRYKTAKAIAEEYNSGTVNAVVLVSATSYANALPASVLAYQKDAPVLLVNSTAQETTEAFDYMSAHLSKTGTVYLVGDNNIIGSDFTSKLNDLSYSNVIRISGIDKYDTGCLIAQELDVPSGTPIIISSGENFPDALAVSGYAARNEYPIILVSSDGITEESLNYIKSIQPNTVYITGGTGAVSSAIESRIKNNIPTTNIQRFAGSDRFDTAAQIVEHFSSGSVSDIFVTSGFNYPDAIAGSVLAAKFGSPIVLVDPKANRPSNQVEQFLQQLNDPNIVIFGGIGAVPNHLATNIYRIINSLPIAREELKVSVVVKPSLTYRILSHVYSSSEDTTALSDFSEGLAVVTYNNYDKGYVNTAGKKVIDFKYVIAESFLDGFAAVGKYVMGSTGELIKMGYIDKTGKEIVPLKYDGVYTPESRGAFVDGPAWVKLNGKYGYVDKTGREVVAPKYDEAEPFSDGMARVKLDGKYGYIDTSGREVVAPKYGDAETFSGGVARVNLDYSREKVGYDEEKKADIINIDYGSWGLIDNTGQEVLSPKYFDIWSFHEGLASVNSGGSLPAGYAGPGTYVTIIKGGKWGFINTMGNEVIPLQYDGVGYFSEGLAVVERNKKAGFVNTSGAEVIPLIYDYAFEFTGGLAMVERNDKWGFINQEGKEIVPVKYDDTNYFYEGLAVIQLNGKYGYVNKKGEEVIAPIYEYANDFAAGKAEVTLNGQRISIDQTGKQITDAKEYAWVKPYYEGLRVFAVNRNGRTYCGYEDEFGREVVSPQYDWAGRFSEGYAWVELNGKYGILKLNQ